MAKRHPRGHRQTDSPDTFTREQWEQEVRGLALGDFDQIAQGRRTFTVRELRAMPEVDATVPSAASRFARSEMPSMAPPIR